LADVTCHEVNDMLKDGGHRTLWEDPGKATLMTILSLTLQTGLTPKLSVTLQIRQQ
jgi:hypothetical protein